MKRIFTHLFVAVLLMLSTTSWAQSGVQTITVESPGNNGTFKKDDSAVTTGWCSNWTSSTSPVVTISVSNNVNNLAASVKDKFHMCEGQSKSSTWNFSVSGYNITSYSFKFVSADSNNNVTIKAGEKTMVSSSTTQTWSEENLDASTVSIVLSGGNKGIYVTGLTFKVYDPTVSSTLTVGKVYNFKNVEYGKSMAAVGLEKTAIDDTDLGDYTQLWYVGEGSETGTYTLRNLGNGLYLQGAGSGTKWPFVEQPSNLYYQTAGSGFSLTANSGKNAGSQYWMHYGAGNGCVVGWDANAEASQWTVEEVAIDAQALQANWDEVELLNGASENVSVYQECLNNLFFDKSCTTPKKLLSSVSDIESDVDYRALPAGLQAMVKKVYLGEWGEKNIISEKLSWSSEHAKRFRVQLYEPYSYGERTNSMLGIYAHSNMNNPTGLVANQRNLLYVMVEGEIKEGASLYLQSLVGDGRIGDIGGVELTEGLNIIPYWSDGNQLFIQYVVNTYENGAKTGYKLSQYEPLKIHIQGGCINGCFDTVGDALNPADTDEDWDAYEVRAHQYNFTVLGKYVMWHMPLVIDDSDPDYYDLSECLGTDATSVKTAMGAWETIESAQRLMEGLLSEEEINTIPNASRVFEYTGNDPYEQYPSDYSEEYNNRSMAYSTKDGYFMFAADWSTHYASNTLDDVILNIATAGDPWGPSHEIGHTYQGPINLPSTSETSNNAIANVSNWFLGRTSSRLGSTQSLLEQYNNNTSFLGTDVNSGNVWEKLMMYTKLWFYYHVTGHNKTFYPRLFEMLRRDPIARDKGVALSGNETMLKFYKYACMAAEEDLTDFFEVFGFFVPVNGALSDDYGDFKTVMTQAEIDAAKAEVAAMAAEKGWKKNSAIIFIDDRIGTVYSHDGQTVLQPRGDGGNEQGVLGSINDYDSNPNNDVAPLTGEYSYTVSGNTITMQGATGGVGFLIYDADGNLVSFSNTYSFPLGEEAQAALASGTARVVVTTADINAQPIEIHDANSTQTQAELLAGLLLDVEELLRYKDDSGTKVGYYKSSALAALENAYTAASEVYNNKDLASYGGVYSVLYEEYNAVTTSPAAKIEFVDGRTYYLKNVESGRYMTVEGDNVMATATTPNASASASLWQINAGFYETFYSIKNQSTGTYIRQPQKEGDNYNNGQQFVMTSDPHTFIFEEVSTGKFAIKDRSSKKYLNYHASGSKIATWGGNNAGSQWEIVYLPVDETMEQRTKLEDLVLSTQLLIDEVGFAEYEELKLQKDPSKANYLYCNAPHGSEDGDGIDGDYVANLTDGKTSSYLHTNWGANSTENHYLRVDLGVGNELETIKFAYATRSSTNLDMPSKMLVQGSNSETTGYTTLVTLTKDDAVNPLPTAGSTISWYKSSEIASATPYRFYRFVVTETKRGLKDPNYYVFTMSEFRMYKKTTWLNSEYNTQDNLDLLNAAFEKMVQAEERVSSSAATKAELETAYNNLSEAYEQLLTAKTSVDNSALNAEKERLSALVSSATSLVNECIDGDIIPSPATEVKVVMQATNDEQANYLYCNALYNKSVGNNNGDNCMNTAKLLDDNTETYLHTIPDGQDPDDALDHYLRVDFGDGAQNGMMKFAYHTRKESSYAVFPQVIKIEGSNSLDGEFEEITTISSGLPNTQDTSYESAVFGNGTNYRYVRFMVTDTHADRTTSNNPTYGQHKYFCMAEFDLWVATSDHLEVTLSANCGNATETMVLDAYRAMLSAQILLDAATSVEQLQAAYAVLDAAYTTLYNAKNVVNKDALQSLYDDALALYGTMADGNGNVNADYAPSALTNGMLAAAKSALDDAKDKLDNSNSQSEIDDARTALQAQYNALLAIMNANMATTIDKSELNTAIANANALIAAIEAKGDGYYESVAGLGLVELGIALQNAQDVVDRFYLTEAQYNETLTLLNTCYTTTNGILALDCNSENRNNLECLIADAENLIDEVATVTKVETPVLSSANVYCNADNSTNSGANLGDKRGVDALFDGDVNTHLHTTYGGNAQDDDLDHYIRIDMGEGKAVQAFKFNYIGRASNSINDPSTIVVQACNTVDGDWVTVETLTGLPIDGDKVEYTSPVIEMDQAYRYVRFMVTETQNNSTTTYNEIAHKYFVMSEFGFTAYNTVILKDGYADVDKGLVEALYNEKESADVANDYYMTNETYNSTFTGLQEAYDALNDAKNKAPLKALINATASLKSSLYNDNEAQYIETEIALQNTDESKEGYLYCNAPETNSSYSTDILGVEGCIDLTEGGEPKLDTFLHTEYGGDQSADGLDHYLRVYLGAEGAAEYVGFGYVGRSGHETKSPETVIVEATNDLDGEWTTIKTLTMAQPSATAETKTGALGNGVAYRYWRFMVTDTHFNGIDGNGHKYFALSDFNVYRYDAPLKSEYTPNIYIYATTDLVDEVEDAIAAATAVYDDANATIDDCDNAIKALQPVHDKLAEAIEYYWTPVVLTTDENNPVLYTINAIGRGDGKAWQYNMNSNNITIVDKNTSNYYHLWYFVAGDSERTVKIVPVMTPAYRLDCGDYSNGANKINAGTEGVEWEFVRSATNEYNFKPTGQSIYLSNFGGGSNPLGFYGSVDGGSKVNFTEVAVEDYCLNRLASLVNSLTRVEVGNTVGSFVENTATAFNQAFDNSKAMIDVASSSNAEYAVAFANLFNAYHNLEIIMPQAGTENAPVLYTITNVARTNGKMFAGGEVQPVLCWDNKAVTAKYVFTFEPTGEEGKYYMKSLERGTYISTATGHGGGIDYIAATKEKAKIVTIAKMSLASRAVSITPEDGAMLHADASGNANKVVGWNNSEATNASAWYIDEVTDLSQVTHTVTMNATFSSVMLGYNATVPAGVEAYNAEGVEDGYVTLVEVAREGGVIPANTPVILYRTDNNTSKTFTYTTNPATSVPTETVLGGSLYQKFVECDRDKNYYKLMIKDGEAKMYWMFKEFNSEGVSQGNTNDGGHIKCSANKIYMALPTVQDAVSYGMRFVGGESTDILDFTGEQREDVIYDLQGRKLTEITHPGFYMINGKKVYVK